MIKPIESFFMDVDGNRVEIIFPSKVRQLEQEHQEALDTIELLRKAMNSLIVKQRGSDGLK